MHVFAMRSAAGAICAAIALSAAGSALAQQPYSTDQSIIVNGEPVPDTSAMTEGPELKGVITARSGDKMKVTAPDGTSTLVFINETTKVKAAAGLFGSRSKLTTASLLNGLPVSVKTMQAGSVLLASQVTFKNNDLKTATMIRNGTAQGFAEQTAATQALRGRMGDIDKYNIKSSTNVYFDTGKAVLSERDKNDLCAAATQAEAVDNALLLVVGYTDAVGDDDYNQQLSEKRASKVINYLQQVCGWKPYRMLTPTGMAKADPQASNDTPEGRAQNRRVSVNVLVSKGLDGI